MNPPPPPSLDESIVSRWVGFDMGGGLGRGRGGGGLRHCIFLCGMGLSQQGTQSFRPR